MSELEFNRRPPKTYKKVKDTTLALCNINGVWKQQSVGVWMTSAGTPAFAAWVPVQYQEAWKNHRRAVHQGDTLYELREGFLHAPDFHTLEKRMETIAYCYSQFIQNLNMRKVCWVYSELMAPGISANKVSFSASDVLVGLRIGMGWEVNGKTYVDGRDYQTKKEDLDIKLGKPVLEDLHPHHGHKDVVLDYDPEIWATLVNLEQTLIKAAGLLHGLTNKETALPLLMSGLKLLK